MRLLLLNHNYRYMGTFGRVMDIARHLTRRDHTVTVMTVSREHRWRPVWSTSEGVQIAEMPNLGQNYSGEGYGPLDNLLRCFHSMIHHYDLIHMFEHKPNSSFAAIVGRLRGAKIAADWTDWWGGPGGINDVPKRRVPAIGKFEEWWEVKTKLLADGVTTISTALYQRALDVGCPADRVIYIPNGCPTDRIHPIPIAEAREHLAIPTKRKIVGFLGMGQGDMEIIMPAVKQLPDVWLMVIGPKSERVFRQAQYFGIADRLLQTDFVPESELNWYLACADIMCLPLSDRAANRARLPDKLRYYLSVGRPVIASPVGDVKMIMETCKAGILADDNEFAQAINCLLQDNGLREELGHNARLAAETMFDWEHLIDKLEAFYRRILGTP